MWYSPDMGGAQAFRRRLMVFVISAIAVLAGCLAAAIACVVRMPDRSHEGALPALTEADADLSKRLAAHVEELAGVIGERCIHGHLEELEKAALYVEARFESMGYQVARQPFQVDSLTVRNLEVSIPGRTKPKEVIVVGAHYDSVPGTPGASDNASGGASLLELARLLRDSSPERTIRLVAYVNEEPPWFQTDDMGSVHHARRCKERGDDVQAMLSLETMGYYSDEPGSQHYPPLFATFYPDTGNFIAFVGNTRSRSLVRRCVRAFRSSTEFPSEGAAAPASIPGVGFSDHWSYWQQGYEAVMVTDTAFNRYAHYHEPTDLPDRVDTDRLARVTRGLHHVILDLASA
jgi:Zn-dependent M28 family amino/carboxypeptidase